MPELPEVEVTRLSFASRIQGGQIQSVRMGKPLRWPLGCPEQDLVGARILGVRRRGKYLLMDLALNNSCSSSSSNSNGNGKGLLLLHLGMSGSLNFSAQLAPAGAHDHFDLVTTLGALRLNDPRRFGAVVFSSSEATQPALKLLGHLGMEPLLTGVPGGFELELFKQGLKKRKAPIKQVLLAGDLVVGVGNIYASEVCFYAGVRPTRRAHKVTQKEAERLFVAIQQVLARAVERGGSTLRDFTDTNGQAGHFQREAMVYARDGQACKRCASNIKLVRQGQRSSFFCPNCQKS